jgi:hypothetical protein
MDNFNDDEEDVSFEVSEENLIEFIEEMYAFSMVNVDASLDERVQMANEDEKEMVKSTIIESSSKPTPEAMKEMTSMFPFDDAKDIALKYFKKIDNVYLMQEEDFNISIMEISRGILFGIFKKLEKEGYAELIWDAEKSDFAYRLKNEYQSGIVEEKDAVKEKPKRKRKKK